jgi:hypothetical protein
MLDETKKYFFKKLIDDTIGYYRIYDYLKARIKGFATGNIVIESARTFWEKLNNNSTEIRHKQQVKLKDFYLTEWIPKMPGQIWTPEGRQNLSEGFKLVEGFYEMEDRMYTVLGPVGKMRVISGGHGTVRLQHSPNTDFFAVLNLVHIENWNCDYGIPVVVSKPVYEKFLQFRQNEGAPVVKELTGTLYLDERVPTIEKIPPAIGSKLDEQLIDLLSDQPSLRKTFIYVGSPMNIELLYNDSHPDAIAWTMFRTNINKEPLRLTYCGFNPKDERSLLEAVGFINAYVANFDGTEILTDFDGITRRFISSSSLSVPKKLNSNYLGTLKLISKWVEHEIENDQ